MSNHPQDPHYTSRWVNLAQPRLGAEVIYATDEFFAQKERMLNPEPAVFIPGKYDDHGKWMDGWETRRRRGEGYDFSIVRLGRPGVIKEIDIDTSHFTGNYPPAASIDACYSADAPDASTQWVEIVPSTSLQGNAHHLVPVQDNRPYTHVRLNIYPDGGIARLRVYGQIQQNWDQVNPNETIDLVALEHGGRVIKANDSHFGSPDNLIAPGRGINMGDGWETRRRREPGNDWAIIALGHAGIARSIEVDTAFFKGNYPDRCSVQAAYVSGGTDQSLVTQSMFWKTLLPEQKLSMDNRHVFESLNDLGPITHVRLNIFPDGGISRFRLFGQITK